MFDKKAYDQAYRKANPERYKVHTRKYQLANYSRQLFNSAKNRAKRDGIEFSIGLSDVVVPERCPILDRLIVPMGDRKYGLGASIDRIDNNGGYTKGNILVCSLKANRLKNSCNLEDFRKIVKYLEKNT